MQDIIELERRIAAAFDRIDHGLETADRARAEAAAQMPAATAQVASVAVSSVEAPQNPAPPSESVQMAALIRALETARDSSADWAARYAALEARMADETLAMAGQIAQQAADLDAKTQAIADLENLHSAANDGGDTAQQQSIELQAMDDQMRDLRSQLVAQSADLEALRSQRATEIQELNAIIAALNPLIEEAENNA